MRFSKEPIFADPTAGSILGLSDVVQEENAEPALVIALDKQPNSRLSRLNTAKSPKAGNLREPDGI